MLITCSGVDGAGKSTQIANLEQWCIRRGKVVVCLWARGGYTPGFSWLKRILRLVLGGALPAPGPSDARCEKLGHSRIARIWLRVAMLDLLMFWGGYARFQRWLGRVVICDRYIDDTRLDFRRNFMTVPFERMWLWRTLEWVTPRPDAAFLLWIPVEESMRRSREKGEPFPDDEETLAWRLQAYMDDSVFPPDRYIRLVCRRSVSAVSEDIVGKVAEILERGGRADAG